MKRIWIKLHLEILDDPKMGGLSDHIWRRAVELFLIAGKTDGNGALPTVKELAWTLRTSAEDVTETLVCLSEVGITQKSESGEWLVSNFEKRQYSESYERMKRYRERNKDGNSYGESDEEEAVDSSSSSSSVSLSVSEGREGLGEKPIPVPETPKQAAQHPDIKLFTAVSGRIPGSRDYETVINTIQYLREKHGDKLVSFLTPYWTAWSTRKTKEGRPYSPSSMVWLCEWAIQEEMPRANGHEPKKGETKANNQDVIRKVAQNAR